MPKATSARTSITPAVVEEMLGAPVFLDEEMAERTKEPGVAIGLAWTPAGGDVLFIEASRMAGSGSLTLTGQLGDVMKESARAALSWFRAHAAAFGADPDFFKNAEIHLHVPSGAIPKDGPSAGVTMATALASELTRRPVRGDIAMTGEITLSGRVLPVGGIKEKVLAARRVGIREVILPRQNEKNVNEDLTPELRKELTVHYVQTVDEVLLLALQPAPSRDRQPQDRTPRTDSAAVTRLRRGERALSGRRGGAFLDPRRAKDVLEAAIPFMARVLVHGPLRFQIEHGGPRPLEGAGVVDRDLVAHRARRGSRVTLDQVQRLPLPDSSWPDESW